MHFAQSIIFIYLAIYKPYNYLLVEMAFIQVFTKFVFHLMFIFLKALKTTFKY